MHINIRKGERNLFETHLVSTFFSILCICVAGIYFRATAQFIQFNSVRGQYGGAISFSNDLG